MYEILIFIPFLIVPGKNIMIYVSLYMKYIQKIVNNFLINLIHDYFGR